MIDTRKAGYMRICRNQYKSDVHESENVIANLGEFGKF
jgi:hypothetical protein